MKKLIGIDRILTEIQLLAEHHKPFPHILLSGARGTGKTSLAYYISELTQQPVVDLQGPSVDSKNIWTILYSLQENSILFIDEIHRLSSKIEELLYQPMESGNLSINYGGVIQTVPYIKFTLIGATTQPGLISKPLQSRFKIHIQIPNYKQSDLEEIIRDNYPEINKSDAHLIASYVTVPREAINLTFRLLNLNRSIPQGLEFLGYRFGLKPSEIKYLQSLQKLQSASLQTMCSLLQQEDDLIKLIEERLLFKALICITSKGRELTPLGWSILQKLKV